MKVLLVNGSPHRKGETYNALSLVETALNEKGIGTEWFWIGNKPVLGCVDCGKCSKTFRCSKTKATSFIFSRNSHLMAWGRRRIHAASLSYKALCYPELG